MSAEDNYLKILEKISEVSERTARMEVEQTYIRRDVDVIKEQDQIQNKLLDEHIQGTVSNTRRLNLEIKNRQELESRVDKLEEAPKFLSTIKKYAKWITPIVAAILLLIKLFHHL